MPFRALAFLSLLAFPGLAGESAAPDVEFRLQYLAVHGRRDATLTYDFDGDGKGDVLNTSVDFDKNPPDRWLAIHFQRNGGYSETPDAFWSVSDRACALVFGDFLPGGGTEVGYLAEDGLYVYPWAKNAPAETAVKVLHVRTFFRSPSLNQIHVWQWRMDFTSDGLDDLIVPLSDGYRIYFQTAPGVFGKTATLEADLPPTASRAITHGVYAAASEGITAHFQAASELPRIEPVDINGDGLSDVVLIKKDEITYFLQKEKGVFPSVRPSRVSYAVPTLREEPRKDAVNLAIIRFVDINQDKLADLAVTKIEGQLGLWESIKTKIYIHLGTGRGNFIPAKMIQIDGVSIDPEFIDMNLDGKLDVVTSRLRTDLMKQAVNAFVLGDVQISYEVFQFDPVGNTFLEDPVFEKAIFVAKRDLEKTGAGAIPLVFIRGDLSGDGRPDMVQIKPKDKEAQLLIYPGRVQDTPDGLRIGFDGTEHWSVKVDRHPRGLQLLDVNSDGLNDIVLYHAGALGLVLSKKR